MATDEERIALFIDHENLVLGARDIGRTFDIGPIMDALAERGRVVARRAYADWTLFADDRRTLVEHNCELIDIPQRTGTVRAARRAAGGNGGNRPATKARKASKDDGAAPAGERDLQELQRMLTQTLAGLKQSGAEPVLASSLKRALLRKDPTFAESDYGFRAFGELLRQAERNGVIALSEGQARGDPAVDFPEAGQGGHAFDVLRETVRELQGEDGEVPLSGLKDQLRKRAPDWSEKDLGYSGFLQFVKAAAANGVVVMEWDDAEGDYFLFVPD